MKKLFFAICIILVLATSALAAPVAEPKINPDGTINAAAFTSFSACKTDPISAGRTISVKSVMPVNTLTVSEDRSVEIKKGGKLRYSGNLAIKGQFTAGLYHALEKVGSGTVSFATGTLIHPAWAGLKGDGVTDNGSAMDTLNSWISGTHGAKVQFTEGWYKTSQALWPCGYGTTISASGKVVIESIDGGNQYALLVGNPDPGDLSTSNRLQANLAKGADEITLLTVAGYKVDDVVYVFSGRSTNSSGPNQIPLYKQFFTIKSIDTGAKKIKFTSESEYDFNTADDAAIFTSSATPAVGLTIENVHFTNKEGSFTGAYLHGIAYGLGITLRNVRLDGYSAVGFVAFADKVIYDNVPAVGYSGFSTARGAKRVTFRDSSFNFRQGAAVIADTWGMFLEETPERVTIDNCDIHGAVGFGSSSDSSPPKQIIMRDSKITAVGLALRVLGIYNPDGFAVDIDRSVFDAPGGINTATRKSIIFAGYNDTIRITNSEFVNAAADAYAIDADGTFTNARVDLKGNSYGASLGINTTVVDTANLAYAAGSFTPVLKIDGSTTGITYATNGQVGRYTRIGNQVFYSINIILTSKGATTGNVSISGLPVSKVVVTNYIPAGATQVSNTVAGFGSYTATAAVTGDTEISLYKMVSGVATTMTNSDITDTFEVVVTGHYEI